MKVHFARCVPWHKSCLHIGMLYSVYDLWNRSVAPLQLGAWSCSQIARMAYSHMGDSLMLEIAAEFEAVGLTQVTHSRPKFNIQTVGESSGSAVTVEESVVSTTPFAKLIKFKRAGSVPQPKILLVAPMSGHFSTLLRGTISTLIQDHDVYLTDWLNPRDIAFAEGEFDFAAFVHHLIGFLRVIGPGTHLMGVCQPVVACLAAASLMADDQDPCEPASLILMAGPVDTRQNPTKVNQLAKENSIDWFEENLILRVPVPNYGAGRRVYPGFIQLLAFMSMNRERHLKAFKQLKEYRADGQHDKANAIGEFYREYFAVMDLPAAFYLETVERIFQRHDLPLGRLKVHDRQVNCGAIRKPFLLTIEGERDDICGIGQTLAAHDLCSKMPMYKKSHLLQPGVGHYGVFSGKRWERRTYPAVKEFIQSAH